MTAEVHTGTLESKDQGTCRIDGIDYKVPDYVIPFLERRKPGDKVEYSFTEGEAGRRLTKIAKPFTKREEKPQATQQPAEAQPKVWKIKVIKVNEVALKYETVTNDPALAGQRVVSLTPAEFGKFTNAGIKEGDTVEVVFDNQGFPHLMGEITPASKILKENIDRINGPANGEIVDPPGGELVKAPPKEEEKPQAVVKENLTTARTVSQPAIPEDVEFEISVCATVNLENFESLKVQVSGWCGHKAEGVILSELDHILSLMGRSHELTRASIDSYRKRVLGGVVE